MHKANDRTEMSYRRLYLYTLMRIVESKVQLEDFSSGSNSHTIVHVHIQSRSQGIAIFRQLAVILAYAIMDYKCQGDTYIEGLLSDLRKLLIDSIEAVSLYIQLSRMQSLQHLLIIGSFDPEELRTSLLEELLKELEWEI